MICLIPVRVGLLKEREGAMLVWRVVLQCRVLCCVVWCCVVLCADTYLFVTGDMLFQVQSLAQLGHPLIYKGILSMHSVTSSDEGGDGMVDSNLLFGCLPTSLPPSASDSIGVRHLAIS